MITFPPEFVAIKYPGYFYNTADRTLYTLKTTGELRPLAFRRANKWNHFRDGYQVSHRGRRRFITVDYLRTLLPQTVPVAKVADPEWVREAMAQLKKYIDGAQL